MDYQALALKWRPRNFGELVGQEAVTAVLSGALEQNRIASAYLFSGPRGCGKTSSARILAKSLNCEEGPTPLPCDKCDSCREITEGRSLAVKEIDAASNRGIADIQNLREEVGLSSLGGRMRVFIIDEAHQITGDGANAFLKTLEEPPPGVVFILATTEPEKIIPTIRSRCQSFQFRLLTTADISGRLREIAACEKISVAEEVLDALARKAEGSMRDGLTLLDQVVASIEGEITLDKATEILGLFRAEHYYQLTEAFLGRDSAAAIRELGAVLDTGLSMREFSLGLVRYFRNLLMLKIDSQLLDAGEMGSADQETAQRFAESFSEEDLLYLTRLAGDGADRLRYASQPRIMLEALVVEIARFESRMLLSEVLAELRQGTAAPQSGPARSQSTSAESAQAKPARASRPRPPTRKAATPLPDAVSRVRETAPAQGKLTDIEGGWDNFVARVTDQKKALGSFLEHSRPGDLGDKHFTILLENPFYLNYLDGQENLEVLRNAFSDTFGARRSIRLELHGEDGTAERVSNDRADDARKRQALKDHEGDSLVEALLTRFDGEVIED